MPSFSVKTYIVLIFAGLINVLVQDLAAQQIESSKYTEAHSAYIDGLAAFENEDYERALDLLNTAYVKLPDHPGINFALADAYFQINDIGNAEYYGKQAIKLDPENRWFRLKLVEIYQSAGNTEAAINEINEALEYHPKQEDLLYKLAELYSNQGNLKKANEIYGKLMQFSGDNISLRLQRLENFNRLGMQDSTIAELQQIRKLEPGNLSTLQVLSNHYLEMDRLKEAREVLQKALQINRRDPQTLIMLSDVYMEEEKWDSVAVTLGNVVADSAVSSQTKLKVGKYLYSKFRGNSDDEAIHKATSEVFQKIMDSEPESGDLWNLIADFFTETRQTDHALHALERTTDLRPGDDSAWHHRLQLLMQEGKVKETISAAERAIEYVPQDPVILYFLGNAYLSTQKFDKAIENLEEASDLPARNPLKTNIYGSLGDAYAAAEKWNQAFEHYEQSLSINNENAVVLNNYAYYLALQQKDLSKAEQMARKATDLDPENPSYLDTLGWIFYQQKEYEKAEEYISKAVETGQPSAEVLEHMGDVLDKLNKTEEAKTWWQKALDKDSTRTHLQDKILN